jgi:hypothetical protein
MGVPLVQQPFCKVCSRVKGKTNGWFLVRIDAQEFCFRDYNEDLLPLYNFAVCGAEHLDKLQREHVEKLLGIRSGGAAGFSPSKAQTASTDLVFSE